MNVDLFDFDLPTDRIALRPETPRDAARLLVLEGDATRDLRVTDLAGQLRRGDLLVFNDTRVTWERETVPGALERLIENIKVGLPIEFTHCIDMQAASTRRRTRCTG